MVVWFLLTPIQMSKIEPCVPRSRLSASITAISDQGIALPHASDGEFGARIFRCDERVIANCLLWF